MDKVFKKFLKEHGSLYAYNSNYNENNVYSWDEFFFDRPKESYIDEAFNWRDTAEHEGIDYWGNLHLMWINLINYKSNNIHKGGNA